MNRWHAVIFCIFILFSGCQRRYGHLTRLQIRKPEVKVRAMPLTSNMVQAQLKEAHSMTSSFAFKVKHSTNQNPVNHPSINHARPDVQRKPGLVKSLHYVSTRAVKNQIKAKVKCHQLSPSDRQLNIGGVLLLILAVLAIAVLIAFFTTWVEFNGATGCLILLVVIFGAIVVGYLIAS